MGGDENCEGPVRSNALQEAVGRGRFELDVIKLS